VGSERNGQVEGEAAAGRAAHGEVVVRLWREAHSPRTSSAGGFRGVVVRFWREADILTAAGSSSSSSSAAAAAGSAAAAASSSASAAATSPTAAATVPSSATSPLGRAQGGLQGRRVRNRAGRLRLGWHVLSGLADRGRAVCGGGERRVGLARERHGAYRYRGGPGLECNVFAVGS